MSFTLRCLTFLMVAVVGVAAFGWMDRLHLQVGALPAGVLLLLALALLWVSRTQVSAHRQFRESPLREALLGALTGAAWTGLMLLYFFVAARTPGAHAFFLDADRAAVDRSVSLLETNGNYGEAAQICLDTLKSPRSAEWMQELAERAVRNLTLAAERSPHEAEALLRQALCVAEDYGVSADYPRSVKASLVGRLAQSALEGDVAAAFKQLKSTDASRQEAERLLGQHQRQSAAALQAALAKRLQAMLSFVRAALADDLPTVAQLLDTEVQAAANQHVATTDAVKILAEVRAVIASRQPQTLPNGSHARLLRRVPSPMPSLLILDVEIIDSANTSVAALRSADFVARQQGGTLRLGTTPLSGEGTLELALALDKSDSMGGAKLHEMKPACVEMLRRLPAGVHVRATAFGTDVQTISDWSASRDGAIAGCQQLQAEGATALFAAIADAIRALTDRPGQRHAVIFSDGANSVAGPSREALIAEARRRRVAVHFIALTAGHDDTTDIETIAAQTGGRVLVVADARELSGSFRKVADELTANGYRLAILDADPSQPTEIKIGGVNAVQLVVPALDAHRTVAKQ